MKNFNKGFAGILGIVIAAVVLVLAGGGAWYYKNKIDSYKPIESNVAQQNVIVNNSVQNSKFLTNCKKEKQLEYQRALNEAKISKFPNEPIFLYGRVNLLGRELEYKDFKVSSGIYGEASVNSEGMFCFIANKKMGIGGLVFITKNEIPILQYVLVKPKENQYIEINPKTTAVSMAYLVPGVTQTNEDSAELVVNILNEIPETSKLGDLLAKTVSKPEKSLADLPERNVQIQNTLNKIVQVLLDKIRKNSISPNEEKTLPFNKNSVKLSESRYGLEFIFPDEWEFRVGRTVGYDYIYSVGTKAQGKEEIFTIILSNRKLTLSETSNLKKEISSIITNSFGTGTEGVVDDLFFSADIKCSNNISKQKCDTDFNTIFGTLKLKNKLIQ